MSSRTYLSIGDVLALLRQEFPDVTISKIRFLESQGLVNPERTPSGYRKFYEHDVERLRWVLRQQREHFLPLKVIKGRLEQEVAGDGEDNGRDVAGAGVFPDRVEPVLVGRTSGPGDARAAGRELPGFESPPAETTRRGVEARRGRPAGPSARPDLARGRAVPAAAPPSAPPAPVGAASTVTRTAGAGVGSASSGAVGRAASAGTLASGSGPGSGDRGTGPSGARGAVRSSGTKPDGPAVPGPAKRSGAGATRSPEAGSARAGIDSGDGDEAAPQSLPDDAITLEELTGASGLDGPAVEQLESYGLLCGRVVGGVVYYDGDALTVARVAAGLARYGVEARHLRLHKLAAEREAGFIEQIVLPLLKQRNPEARQRAYEAVAELTVLGQGLREVLLRTTLREQLGG
ncbi:MAG TPA: MerR family transcriptional regulator [Acidimicrobiales bacterium]|nr:MerR family transcriptional regulator [Acidimicrobiales bacterium]